MSSSAMSGRFMTPSPTPVYFNEPISMCQKECEKFFYLDLLSKASNEKNKSLQLGYISAFIIGELFLYLQLKDAEEMINGESKGLLGEILIRCNNVLFVKEFQ